MADIFPENNRKKAAVNDLPETEIKPLASEKHSPGFIIFLCVMDLLIAGVVTVAARLVSGESFALNMGYVFIPLTCFIACAINSVITWKHKWVLAVVGAIAILSHFIFVSASPRTYVFFILYVVCGTAGFGFGTLVRYLASKKAERDKKEKLFTK